MALGQIISQSLARNEHLKAPVAHPPASLSKNLNRLLSAAVVSHRFRHLLLSDPVAALASGYNGEEFHLTPVEYAAVTSLRVSNVRDFATQLLRIIQFTSADSVFYSQDTQVDFRYAEVAIQ